MLSSKELFIFVIYKTFHTNFLTNIGIYLMALQSVKHNNLFGYKELTSKNTLLLTTRVYIILITAQKHFFYSMLCFIIFLRKKDLSVIISIYITFQIVQSIF